MNIIIKIPPFRAVLMKANVRRFLKQVGDATKKKMIEEAAAPKSGKLYHLGGGATYRASAPGEFPANKYGKLSASYRVETEATEVTVGTNVYYSRYLREGTRKMRPRKFLREALNHSLHNEHMKEPFVEWRR